MRAMAHLSVACVPGRFEKNGLEIESLVRWTCHLFFQICYHSNGAIESQTASNLTSGNFTGPLALFAPCVDAPVPQKGFLSWIHEAVKVTGGFFPPYGIYRRKITCP